MEVFRFLCLASSKAFLFGFDSYNSLHANSSYGCMLSHSWRFITACLRFVLFCLGKHFSSFVFFFGIHEPLFCVFSRELRSDLKGCEFAFYSYQWILCLITTCLKTLLSLIQDTESQGWSRSAETPVCRWMITLLRCSKHVQFWHCAAPFWSKDQNSFLLIKSIQNIWERSVPIVFQECGINYVKNVKTSHCWGWSSYHIQAGLSTLILCI